MFRAKPLLLACFALLAVAYIAPRATTAASKIAFSANTPAAVQQGRLHIKTKRGQGYLKTEDLVIAPSPDTIAQVFNLTFVTLDQATIITVNEKGIVSLANKWELAVPEEDNTALFFDKHADIEERHDMPVTCKIKNTVFSCSTQNGRNKFQICSYKEQQIEALVLADLRKPDPDQECTPATLTFERIEFIAKRDEKVEF